MKNNEKMKLLWGRLGVYGLKGLREKSSEFGAGGWKKLEARSSKLKAGRIIELRLRFF